MPYSNRIKTLEESYRLVEIQIDIARQSNPIDPVKLQKLVEARDKYLAQLRDMRKVQYEESQIVDLGDDH